MDAAAQLAAAVIERRETLALFPTNMPVEDWPVVMEREIWRQLPPDPRRLRLVDEATWAERCGAVGARQPICHTGT